MTENTSKYIASGMMILFAVLVYLFGSNVFNMSLTCGGWGMINPACWGLGILDIAASFLSVILAGWFFIIAVLIIALPSDKTAWAVLFGVFLPLAIINWIVPDPFPFIDEIFMTLIMGISGVKMLGASVTQGKIEGF